MDSAWIFRICLFMGISLIVFADYLVDRKEDDDRDDTSGAVKSTENNFNKKGNFKTSFRNLFPCYVLE